MKLSVKRVYDKPATSDGTRILVDRLWPRGVSKENAHVDIWAKEVTPTNELRSWFHENPEKNFPDFQKKYHKELSKNKVAVKNLLDKKKNVTLVTAVKDIEHSHIPTLVSFIKKWK